MEIKKERRQVGDLDRWFSLLGGSALMLYGLRRRSLFGTALAALGGDFVFRGFTGEGHVHEWLGFGEKGLPYGKGIKVRRSVTINRTPDELYRFWRNFENLPTFMKHLESVRVDGQRSHWVARGPLGTTVEWDAEITTERPGDIIGWRSLAGAEVDNAGSVRFERASGNRGTIVRVQLQYHAPGGHLGAAVASLFGREPEQEIREDLRRFKQVMEAGEIPITEGQPSGRAADRLPRTQPAPDVLTEPQSAAAEEPVETASEQSFPASDAPAWTAGGGGA